MSLTVASAALDLAWAEFGVTSITAGTLNTASAMIDHVGVKLNRGAISATSTPSDVQINEWLIRAKQELAETKRFTFKRRYVTADLTAGTYRYALPPDYAGGEISIRDMTNNRKIGVTSNHQFDTIYPDPSAIAVTGAGSVLATIKNNELWLMPPPGADVLELDYLRSGDDITASDILWLPELQRYRCCDFACAEAFMALDQFDKAMHYMMRWETGLKKLAKGDGRKKWATSGYRARSVLQA